MASFNEIRELIFSYSVNSIDLSEFSEKFGPMFYDIEDTNDEDAIQLCYKVESVLAKAAEGLLSEDQIREALIQHINGISIVVNIADEYRDKSVVKLPTDLILV